MENVSSSRSRSLGRQRGSSLERHQRVPSAERQRPPSAERQRVPSAERQRVSSSDRQNERRGSMYTGGMSSSAPAVKTNNSAYLQQASSGEQELSQGQESSRRYAAFLRQDGLLPSDLDNFNTAYNRCLSNVADKSSSQTSMRLESPNDEIAPERLGIQKRRPATTPAALFHLPSSKSHPGPGIACNFDINLEPPTDLSKPSTTSLEEEVAVFQNGLNDVTLQLECIQATQGTILSELAQDIEALQAENTYLRESRNRLQCANDNLLKVVQDLTKELALKKSLDPHLSSSSKNLANKTPQDMLKGLETILNASNTKLDETNEQKTSSKSHQRVKSGVSSNPNKLKPSRYPPGKKPHSNSYSRGDVPRPKTQSSQHDLEIPRRTSSSRQLKVQHRDDEETEPHPSSTSRRHQRRSEDQVDYIDDSDSDEYYSNKKERRKKKKNGCFSFVRKRDSRDHDRNHHNHRH